MAPTDGRTIIDTLPDDVLALVGAFQQTVPDTMSAAHAILTGLIFTAHAICLGLEGPVRGWTEEEFRHVERWKERMLQTVVPSERPRLILHVLLALALDMTHPDDDDDAALMAPGSSGTRGVLCSPPSGTA